MQEELPILDGAANRTLGIDGLCFHRSSSSDDSSSTTVSTDEEEEFLTHILLEGAKAIQMHVLQSLQRRREIVTKQVRYVLLCQVRKQSKL